MYFLSLENLSKYCNSYFPTTQPTCDNGFRNIMSEIPVPKISLNICSEKIRKFSRKIPMAQSFF